MKKIILILLSVFLLISNQTKVQAGKIFGKIEYGNSLDDIQIFFVQSELGYRFNIWNVKSETSGGWTTWAEYYNQDGIGGAPFEDIYFISQKFSYKGFFIKGYHYCAHEVVSYSKHWQDENGNYLYTEYQTNRNWWYGKITTVSAGYEFEF